MCALNNYAECEGISIFFLESNFMIYKCLQQNTTSCDKQVPWDVH